MIFGKDFPLQGLDENGSYFSARPLYIIGFMFQIPITPPQQYLTLSLGDLDFDTFQTNLLSIPNYVLHSMSLRNHELISVNTSLVINLLIVTYIAEIVGELTFLSMTSQIWTVPFLIYLLVVNTQAANKWVVWIVITLFLAAPYCTCSIPGIPFAFPCAETLTAAHAIQVGWCSRNSNTVRSRTVSAAMYNMFCQAGGIVASNIYQKSANNLFLLHPTPKCR